MNWKEKVIVTYMATATGVFSSFLIHEVFRVGMGIRKPLFCPFWRHGYCRECKGTITSGMELE